MNIFLFIYLPILFYALKDHHKAFLLYAITHPILSPLIPFLVLPNLPLIQMETFMNTCWLIYFGLINVYSRKDKKIKFPLKKPYILYSISIIISSCLSPVIPFFQSTMTGYQSILNTFFFTYLLWSELKTIEDVKFYVKGTMVVFFIAIICGFFERFNNFQNPLIEYQISLNPNTKLTFNHGIDESRGGLGRVQSIFNNALACSAYMGIALAFFIYLYINYKKIWISPKWIKSLFLIGMFFVLLFSNSRGGILYLVLSSLFLFKFKNLLRLSLCIPILFFVFYDWITPYLNTISSITNLDNDQAGGSSLSMRVLQFLAASEIWQDSFLFGYGEQGSRYWEIQRPELLGTESIWLKQPLNLGMLGIIVYLYLFYSLLKLSINKSKRYIIGSVVACFAVQTATIGIDLTFQLCLILMAYKLELLSDDRGSIQNIEE